MLNSSLTSDEKYYYFDANTCATNVLVNQALEQLGMTHLAYRPCLVQHIDGISILNNGEKFHRNTLYFKDYLDKLNIKMEDAFTLENQKKLNELLEKDRNIWYNKN